MKDMKPPGLQPSEIKSVVQIDHATASVIFVEYKYKKKTKIK